MKDKLGLFVCGILVGLGLFESLGGYLGIANDASMKSSPWLGVFNGTLFYIAAIIVFIIDYIRKKKQQS